MADGDMVSVDRDFMSMVNNVLLQSGRNASAAISQAQRSGGSGTSNITSGLQAALKTAQDNFNRVMGGGGGGGGGSDGLGYDPTTTMTAYQQQQLALEQQRLQQQANQFNVSESNESNQFSQNYLLDYLKTMEGLENSDGSEIDWARLDLDTRRQTLAETLGAGEFAEGMARLELAEQDMDLKRMLGEGDYQLGQARLAAELQKLGIDARRADLDQQLGYAKLAVDQQIAQARLMEAQGAAAAQQAAAQADMARAQAAIRAVEVELQLGQGNLALGQRRADDAMQLGLEDLTVRREEIGSRERMSGADINLRAQLGMLDAGTRLNIAGLDSDTRRAIANQQAQVDLARIQQEGNLGRAQLLAQLHGQPRDWLRYQTVLQGMSEQGLPANFASIANGGEIPTFQAPNGEIETMNLASFQQDTGIPIPGGGPPINVGMIPLGNSFGGSTGGGTANPLEQFMQYMAGLSANPLGSGGFGGFGGQQASPPPQPQSSKVLVANGPGSFSYVPSGSAAAGLDAQSAAAAKKPAIQGS